MVDINRLKKFGKLKGYKRGYVLFKDGDTDQNMYFILKGTVSLRTKIGDRINTELLGAGKFFGETSVILNIPKMVTCIVEENDTAMIALPQTNFEAFIKEDLQFSLRIMRLLSEQLLEAMGLSEHLTTRLAEYEKPEKPAVVDIEKPMTPEPPAAEKKKPEKEAKTASETKPEKEVKTDQEAAEKEPEEEKSQKSMRKSGDMLPALDTLRQFGIVPPEHGVYISTEWPDAATAISPKPMKCPVCGKPFPATYLSRSKLGIPKTHSDMRKTYKAIEPIYFDVYTCTQCGYSNYPDDFDNLRSEAKQRLAPILTDVGGLPFDLGENIFDINYVFLKLYLAIFCASELKANVVTVPKTWLRISWLYDDLAEPELAHFALSKAYEGYSDAFYKTKAFTGDAEKEVLLLMGELALKLDQEKEALNNFMQVIQSGTANNLHRKKAEDRIYDIRHKDDGMPAKKTPSENS